MNYADFFLKNQAKEKKTQETHCRIFGYSASS